MGPRGGRGLLGMRGALVGGLRVVRVGLGGWVMHGFNEGERGGRGNIGGKEKGNRGDGDLMVDDFTYRTAA